MGLSALCLSASCAMPEEVKVSEANEAKRIQMSPDNLFGCGASKSQMVTPQLGTDAPEVRVIFVEAGCDALEGQSSGVFAYLDDDWRAIHFGPFTRGENRTGRGRGSYAFRLVSDEAGLADLMFRDGQFLLRQKGETLVLVPFGETRTQHPGD